MLLYCWVESRDSASGSEAFSANRMPAVGFLFVPEIPGIFINQITWMKISPNAECFKHRRGLSIAKGTPCPHIAIMRNRATTPLNKAVRDFSGILHSFLSFKLQPADFRLFRKFDNHGVNTTCITCNDSATSPRPTKPSSSRNGPPNPPLVITMVNRSGRVNGSACSPVASAASSP